MIYSSRHGSKPFTSSTSVAALASRQRTFRYYDPEVSSVSASTKVVNDLVELGLAMTNAANFPDKKDADIPAIYTYFGQFIDHDLSAGTDAAIEVTEMDAKMSGENEFDPAKITPIDRAIAEVGVVNQNTGMLDLDSLYGDVIVTSEFDKIFAANLRARSAAHAGKMQIAFPSPHPDGPIEPPRDGANDLLRLGKRLNNGLDAEDLTNLPVGVRNLFMSNSDPTNPIFNRTRALIGDMRNDENLFVAQVHLAWLRLHNAIVDACTDQAVIDSGSDALYEYAKQRTRWVYQWVVANDFLEQVCDADALAQVRASAAALYDWFTANTGGVDADRLPLPMEFSVAAFRFGHTMVREEYDWNKNFGPNAPVPSTLGLLFAFTGGSNDPFLNTRFGTDHEQLPSNWPADFERTALPHPKGTQRITRAIDTNLSFELATLPPAQHELPAEPSDPRQNLAVRNLLKGYQLDLPSAQSIALVIERATGTKPAMLGAADIPNPAFADIFAGTSLTAETPLWYYVLREAEVMTAGEKLGPIGTHIVASTMLGLIKADPSTFWSEPGSDPDGRWQPADMPAPNGVHITSLADVLRAALVLS